MHSSHKDKGPILKKFWRCIYLSVPINAVTYLEHLTSRCSHDSLTAAVARLNPTWHYKFQNQKWSYGTNIVIVVYTKSVKQHRAIIISCNLKTFRDNMDSQLLNFSMKDKSDVCKMRSLLHITLCLTFHEILNV